MSRRVHLRIAPSIERRGRIHTRLLSAAWGVNGAESHGHVHSVPKREKKLPAELPPLDGQKMTTEIAVINRLGVALATDSAVTIGGEGGMKVFETADKLFELSPHHPVGVMINGSMDFLGVPWEILIREFRKLQGEKRRTTVRDWTTSLLLFIQSHSKMAESDKTSFVRALTVDMSRQIQNTVSERLWGIARNQADQTAMETQSGAYNLLLKYIEETSSKLKTDYDEAGVADSLTACKISNVKRQYRPLITDTLKEIFAPIELTGEVLALLLETACSALMSKLTSDLRTGLIIAGYGGDDIFPSLCVAEVDGSVCDLVKYSILDELEINREKNKLGSVISFAQTDVIQRLLGGADPRFVQQTTRFIHKSISIIAKRLGETLKASNVSFDEPLLKETFESIAGGVADEYFNNTADEISQTFVEEFNDMIALMPKQEVIELAEALVSITAVERKASSTTATVGGPVDVAMITRSEGFVWVKRKHYFKAEYNPRYIWRNYGEGHHAAQDGDIPPPPGSGAKPRRARSNRRRSTE